MTTKERVYLKGLAVNIPLLLQIGKLALHDEGIASVAELLEARELIKISVLKNCVEDPKILAQEIAQRTRSEVVQVIGKKIVLYKQADDPKKRKLMIS